MTGAAQTGEGYGSGEAGAGILNAMTVDVEEHFQVTGFEGVVPRDRWDDYPSRVEANTSRLLDLFDEAGVRATFFVLGWVAERNPGLVPRIAERGHEVASHGESHRLVYTQQPDEFRRETCDSRKRLQDQSGQPVLGYRAASFSIGNRNRWALDVLVEAGFRYDSSLYPVVHDRYGIPGAPRTIGEIRAPSGGTLIEVPPATLALFGAVLPVAGGGYLRLLPGAVNAWAIGRMNRLDRAPAVVYLHPWEVDPEQPRVPAAPLNRFRHYVGLRGTERKLRRLMARFRFGSLARVIAEATGVEPARARETAAAVPAGGVACPRR